MNRSKREDYKRFVVFCLASLIIIAQTAIFAYVWYDFYSSLILKLAQETVSLETPVGSEEESHLADFIEDEHTPLPSDEAAFGQLKDDIRSVLDKLNEREQKVLRMRFGLDDGRARTLEEVGREFDVTRERIRQIEAKALRKLRHPSRSRKLRDYLD